MGSMVDLHFSHGDASWTYTDFLGFRRRVAESIGIDLDTMWGSGGNRYWETVDDLIVPLLQHSLMSHRGCLWPNTCLRVSDRLAEIIQDWSDDYDRQQAELLIEGMRDAAAKYETFELVSFS